MTPFLAEVIGTLILVLLGDGVVANVVLGKTKGNNGGWIVITAGWAFAVTIAVYCTSAISGAHLNPAVTVAMASLGKFDWALVPGYIAAQMIGAFLGAVLVWLSYLPHWKETADKGAKLGTFATIPAIRHPVSNLICEAIGTAMLVLGILTIITPENLVPDTGFDKAFSPALVGLIVWSIGLSLGGPTGYAINPARDLGPRIAHALLPIPGKGGSDWGYAWVPVVGPIIGGLVGAFLYKMLWNAAVM
ncbi:MIP/aquaporin family protein [Prosthecobacter sp. SYSU 5D2]|uniref:MIP/aquaporin family protein n=1 Tax=Prosthecobacter sp. SYSU 5D2 TaxID=3134134 RepID=UPI0031FEA62D